MFICYVFYQTDDNEYFVRGIIKLREIVTLSTEKAAIKILLLPSKKKTRFWNFFWIIKHKNKKTRYIFFRTLGERPIEHFI